MKKFVLILAAAVLLTLCAAGAALAHPYYGGYGYYGVPYAAPVFYAPHAYYPAPVVVYPRPISARVYPLLGAYPAYSPCAPAYPYSVIYR